MLTRPRDPGWRAVMTQLLGAGVLIPETLAGDPT